MAPEGITNASNNGIRITSKKSGYTSNMLAITKRSKTDRLEINTVSRTFVQFFLDIFNKNMTIAASAKSIIRNNRSSPTFQSSNNRISIANRITLTISQNTQLFSQDLIFPMSYKLENK